MNRLVIAMTLVVLTGNSAPAAAQTSDSSRWLPWFGCWQPVDQQSPVEGVHVCVVPSESGAAKIITMTGDEKALEDTMVPDGVARAVEETGCTGTRRTQWAPIGPRVFSSSELRCEGQPDRRASGISLIGPGDEWIDVQAMLVGKEEIVRVRRYRRSSHEPPSSDALPADLRARAALETGTPFTVDDVIEANRIVSPLAIEAAIFELQRGFSLDRRQLIALDDAGVSDSVIDLMVALTFPRKFEVRHSSGGGGWFAAGPGFFEPYYAYSLFGGPYYWDDWYDEPGNGGIVVRPPVAHGRVVNGAGYTQVSPRPPVAAPTNGRRSRPGDSGNSSSASTPSSGPSGASSSSSGESGSSGGASSGGYSAGATSSDTGRTAVAR